MTTPKFKIGDRVKWVWGRIGVIAEAHEDNRYSFKTPLGWASKVPGDHLSLDVPEPKFKIGDRVKWGHFGKPSSGFVRAHISDGWWKVEYTAGCMANFHESGISLDVPEPKQFATDLEAKLGAEVIKLHYDVAHLDARLTEEVGGRHRERIAKEAAQKELAEAREGAARVRAKFESDFTFINTRLTEARRELVRERDLLADIYTAMLKPRI